MPRIENTRPRILIVDDDPAVNRALSLTLSPSASALETALTVEDAIRLLGHVPCDIVISDLCLPSQSGIDLLRFIRGAALDTAFILLTGRFEPDDLAAGIRLGLNDLLVKPVSVRSLREAAERNWQQLQQSRTRLRAAQNLEQRFSDLSSQSRTASLELTQLRSAVVDTLLSTLAVREIGSLSHSHRVQAYTLFLASAVSYPIPLLPHLEHAALLHDIGKLGLSDSLLSRAGPLTPAEQLRLQPHAILGEQILARLTFLRPAAQIVRHHHERFDGTGFPDRLSGNEIPLGSRIFAIADALDAITSDHMHRGAENFEAAVHRIAASAGTQFDPHLIETFCSIPIDTWLQIRSRIHEEWPD